MKPVRKSLVGLSLLAPAAVLAKDDKPNIVFFLVDDMGWVDSSVAYGEEVYPNNLRFHTPNMDRLAREGVILTSAYACPVSTPTRTSLLTGMNAAHTGITNWTSTMRDTPSDATGGAVAMETGQTDPSGMEHQRHESRSGRGAYAVRHTAAAAAQGCGLFHHSRGQGALGVGRYAGSQSLQHGLRRQRFGQRGRNAAQLPERGELRQYARKVEHAGRAEHDRVLRYGRAPDRSAHARGAQNARISHPARRALLPLYGALRHPYADPARQNASYRSISMRAWTRGRRVMPRWSKVWTRASATCSTI